MRISVNGASDDADNGADDSAIDGIGAGVGAPGGDDDGSSSSSGGDSSDHDSGIDSDIDVGHNNHSDRANALAVLAQHDSQLTSSCIELGLDIVQYLSGGAVRNAGVDWPTAWRAPRPSMRPRFHMDRTGVWAQPLHYATHWSMAIIDFDRGVITIFDSMISYSVAQRAAAVDIVVQATGVTDVRVDGAWPQQGRNNDCGLFALRAAAVAAHVGEMFPTREALAVAIEELPME
jgi:hypothetical protein